MSRANNHLMTIGIFAVASQFSLKALRLYNRLGLLQPAFVNPINGYRYYRTEQLREAKIIRLMRQIDMPLALIRRIISAEQEDAERQIVHYWESIEARLKQGRTTKIKLLTFLKNGENNMEFDVKVKEIATQFVLSTNKKVKIENLSDYIAGSLESLKRLADEHGKITAAPFGIYHGPVNGEDEGPVEVCLPVSELFDAGGDFTTRRLDGGKAASVTVTGVQCQYPMIIEAYDALSEWAVRQGFYLDGAPREIWKAVSPEKVFDIEWSFRATETDK